jgi:hypothetical protein
LQTKAELLNRLEGREEKVHGLHERKREEVHEEHKEKIGRVLQKSNEIIDSKITALINSIGEDFRKSSEAVTGQLKAQQKRLKDRRIDEEDRRSTVKSNLMDRIRQRSSSLSECNCRRINNVEEALSPALKEQTRHTHFADTLRRL